MFITIFWQIILIVGLSGNAIWDPAIINFVAAHKSIALWYPDYFSYNPNNLALLFIERFIYNLLYFFGIKSYSIFIIVLNVLSYLILDLSIFVLFVAVKRIFNKKVGIWSVLLLWILLGVSPIGVIPYSDILAFFISTLFLLVYSYCDKAVAVVEFGLLSAFAILIKPSLIIFIIALAMINLFKRIDIKKFCKIIILFSASFLLVYVPFNIYKSNNSVVNIDLSKKIPANHFVAMGMVGNGGFNNDDVEANHRIKNPQERNNYNNKLIVKRLKNMGVGGYTKFLILKQINNTSDAGFGWGMDAGPKYLLPFSEKIKLQSIPRKIFLNSQGFVDVNWKGFKIFPQIIWSMVLITTLISVMKVDEKELILKLTLLGGFIFLLLFEGGRSRYVIQFLPYIIILASITINKLCIKFKDRSMNN